MTTQIPTNPEDLRQIMDAMKEISNSLARMDAERELIREILLKLNDDYDLNKKYMRKVANIFHKQNIADFKEENQLVEEVYESLTRG
ncbi:MAG: hypothetical protein CBB72_016265 [Muricauda sp. TMED12]|nr:MAG: hypothetical protein CBB72_016265 [Muricauda sp. TMED12]